MDYRILELANETSQDIDEYVRRKGSLYHLTDWSPLIKRVFNHNTYYFYALNNDYQVCGVLPVVNLNSILFGNYMVSMPFFNYGGVIADNVITENLLLDYAIEKARNLNVQHIEFRDTEPRRGMETRAGKVNMLLELPGSMDEVGNMIGSKKRSQVRRSLKEGVEVLIGQMELLANFYHVFSENMRDLGTPVYPMHFFKEILTRFPDMTKIIILKKNDKPISAAFLIGFNGKLEIPWASTLRKYNSFSPNMLLYWEVLKFAIESGYKIFDFGRSTIDSGTYRFKKQWGAMPLHLHWNYWLNNGNELPNLSPNNPKYKIAISLWKRMPLVMANFIGPKIVKNLP